MVRASIPGMTAKRSRPKAAPHGRFAPSAIADRLESLRKEVDVEPKVLGHHIWPKQTPDNAARAWYKRAKQKRIPFKFPEIEAAIDFMLAEGRRKGMLTARTLPGFPFVDLYVSIAIERGDVPQRNN